MIQDLSLMFSVKQTVAAAGALGSTVDLGASKRGIASIPMWVIITAESGNPNGYSFVLQGSDTIDANGVLTSAVTIATILLPVTALAGPVILGMPNTAVRYLGGSITGSGASVVFTAGLVTHLPNTIRTYDDAIAKI